MVGPDSRKLKYAADFIERLSKERNNAESLAQLAQAAATVAVAEQLNNFAEDMRSIKLWLWSDQNPLNKKQ